MIARKLLALAATISIATTLVIGPLPVAAGRFGPPWMDRVTADQTQIYADADLSANVVGPLAHGAILVVTGEQTDTSGNEWTRTTLGFVPSQEVAEDIDPWVADVTAASVPVYAKPNNQDVIRLNKHQGDLLRVTGVSAGMQGDTAAPARV